MKNKTSAVFVVTAAASMVLSMNASAIEVDGYISGSYDTSDSASSSIMAVESIYGDSIDAESLAVYIRKVSDTPLTTYDGSDYSGGFTKVAIDNAVSIDVDNVIKAVCAEGSRSTECNGDYQIYLQGLTASGEVSTYSSLEVISVANNYNDDNLVWVHTDDNCINSALSNDNAGPNTLTYDYDGGSFSFIEEGEPYKLFGCHVNTIDIDNMGRGMTAPVGMKYAGVELDGVVAKDGDFFLGNSSHIIKYLWVEDNGEEDIESKTETAAAKKKVDSITNPNTIDSIDAIMGIAVACIAGSAVVLAKKVTRR